MATSLVERFFPKMESLENPKTPLSNPAAWLTDALTGGKTPAGITVDPHTALGYPPLWRGLNLISNDVAGLPLVVYRKLEENSREPDKTHPAYPILRWNAAPNLTAFVFKKTVTFHALFYGNGYAAIFRDQQGRPKRMMILDPQDTAIVQQDGRLIYITEIVKSMDASTGALQKDPITIPAEDVLHIKGLSNDGIVGFSVLGVMAEALGLGLAARRFGSKFFAEGSHQSGLLLVPGHFTETQTKNLLNAWNEIATGLAKSHKIGLLQDGVEFKPLSITPEEGQFLETRQFEVREVANILGLPPHKLGDSSRTSFKSLESEEKAYQDESLSPWLNAWEDEARNKLMTEREREEDTHFVEFLRNSRLQMAVSYETRMQGYETLMGMTVVTGNDIARKENLPTYGEEGDRRFRSQNLMPLDEDLIDEDDEDDDFGGDDEGGDDDGGNAGNNGRGPSKALQPVPNLNGTNGADRRRLLFHAHTRGLTDALNRSVGRLAFQARSASKKPNTFVHWMEKVREQHWETVQKYILPNVENVCCISGQDSLSVTDLVCDALFSEFLDCVETVYSSASHSKFSEAVSSAMDRFEAEMPNQLLDNLKIKESDYVGF